MGERERERAYERRRRREALGSVPWVAVVLGRGSPWGRRADVEEPLREAMRTSRSRSGRRCEHLGAPQRGGVAGGGSPLGRGRRGQRGAHRGGGGLASGGPRGGGAGIGVALGVLMVPEAGSV